MSENSPQQSDFKLWNTFRKPKKSNTNKPRPNTNTQQKQVHQPGKKPPWKINLFGFSLSKLIVFSMLLLLLIPASSASVIDDANSFLSGLTKNFKPLSGYGDDFTIESITATKVISNDDDLNTADFIVTAIANGGGQSIVGTFDSADFKQYTGYDITFPLKVGISGVHETFKYPIRNDGIPIYKYRGTKTNRPDYWNGITCPDKATDGYYDCIEIKDAGIDGFLGNDQIIKIYRDIIGSSGSFDNPFISWSGDLTMTVAGVPITKKIDSVTGQSVEFYVGNEWKSTARWTGSLITGNPTPNQNLYRAVYLKSRGTWTVTANKYYDDYKNAVFDWKKFYYQYPNAEDAVNKALQEYNGKVDILTSQNDRITYTSATGATFAQTTTGGESNGNVISEGTLAIGYPKFQFITKAKSLGVLIPTGKPKIISVDFPTFSSGDNTGTIIVRFTNTGLSTASFTASVTQINSPFSQQGAITPVSVSPGGIGTISVMIGHGTAGTGTVTGMVRVYDTNKPSNYDEAVFQSTMTAPKACIPGSPDVRGNLVYGCKSDGSGYELILNCLNGQIPVYEGGKYVCKDASPLPTPKPPCVGDNCGQDMTWLFWLAIGLIIAFVAWQSGFAKSIIANPVLLIPMIFLIFMLWLMLQMFLIISGIADRAADTFNFVTTFGGLLK